MHALILGQGIAGTLMAATLLEENCEVHIADPGISDSSSRVAAGMIHPVTGRRLAKSWMLDDLLPLAVSTYRRHEQLLGVSFLHELKTLELYQDTAHRNEWMARSADPALNGYTGDECPPENVPDGITPGIGGMYLLKGGWLDTNKFLDAWRKYFLQKNCLEEITVNEEEIEFNDKKVIYANREYDFVIDCRGAASATSPWFSHLPFNPAKGEVITLQCDLPELKTIIHKSVKLIPTGNPTEFICGATFSWHSLDTIPTEKGKMELQDKLNRMLQVPYKVLSQRAGIRPATKDRRPFVGQHPEISSLFILNGLGAKGVLLGPRMAEVLKNLLLNKTQVMPEISLQRNF